MCESQKARKNSLAMSSKEFACNESKYHKGTNSLISLLNTIIPSVKLVRATNAKKIVDNHNMSWKIEATTKRPLPIKITVYGTNIIQIKEIISNIFRKS